MVAAEVEGHLRTRSHDDRLALQPRGGIATDEVLQRAFREARPRIPSVGGKIDRQLLPLL